VIQRSEVRGQRSEVGGRRSEVGGRRSEVGGQRLEVGGQRSEVGGRRIGQLIRASRVVPGPCWGRGRPGSLFFWPCFEQVAKSCLSSMPRRRYKRKCTEQQYACASRRVPELTRRGGPGWPPFVFWQFGVSVHRTTPIAIGGCARGRCDERTTSRYAVMQNSDEFCHVGDGQSPA